VIFGVREFWAKKEGHEKSRALLRCEGNFYLQRGTADAAALGGKPLCASTECDMVLFWAWRKDSSRMPDMQFLHAGQGDTANSLILLVN
jgi:hypothetical protein